MKMNMIFKTLLHALLLLYFDDVRAEEWTPSYAGKSSRMDFLLKNERVVIEVKKTRQGLADKELGDQLIIDVDRYKVHPDCKRLICFVIADEHPEADFIIMNGNRILIKRQKFEEYLDRATVV